MMPGKYRLSTLGCKVNQYESEQVRLLLEDLGLCAAAEHEAAEIAVVNTCAVTTCAASRSRQALRHQVRAGCSNTIAIGCYAAADPTSVIRLDGVCAALGHDRDVLSELRRLILERLTRCQAAAAPAGQKTTTRYSISRAQADVNSSPASSPAKAARHGRTRALLKVQDGCDAHCSYCIVPHLRPRLSSKPLPEVVEEARRLVAAGHREIVLTGVYLGAYGRTTSRRQHHDQSESPLAALVAQLAGLPGLCRLRLSSLEPGDVDEALLAVLAGLPTCVPHLHIPLQSGSAAVLRRMNRQYTVDEYRSMLALVSARLDRPALTTDVIVGFPGETGDDFAATLAVAREAGFCKIHAFPFSPRPGTAAARWTDRFVPPAIMKERMARLRAAEAEMAEAYRRQFVGQTVRVIVERCGAEPPDRSASGPDDLATQGRPWARGRCDQYFEIAFPADGLEQGDVVAVRIEQVRGLAVRGRLEGKV